MTPHKLLLLPLDDHSDNLCIESLIIIVIALAFVAISGVAVILGC